MALWRKKIMHELSMLLTTNKMDFNDYSIYWDFNHYVRWQTAKRDIEETGGTMTFIKKDGQRYQQITKWAPQSDILDVEFILLESEKYITEKNEQGQFAIFMNIESLLGE